VTGGTTSEIRYVDATPQRKGRPDDIAFRSMPAHAQTRYAAGLEKMSVYGIEATFGEVAKNEWNHAWDDWTELGNHVFVSFNEVMRDGKMVRDNIKLNDACDPERMKAMPDNQAHWTNRWSDQMNFRYWVDRCKAEGGTKAVEARQLFYEGTKAYKTGDFPLAADKFKQGLAVWKDLLDDYPVYRDDELNKKDTGQIVKRYVRVLRQNLTPIPDDLPFKEHLKLVAGDTTVDPFDTLEMIGVPTGESPKTPVPAAAPAPSGPTPANRDAAEPAVGKKKNAPPPGGPAPATGDRPATK